MAAAGNFGFTRAGKGSEEGNKNTSNILGLETKGEHHLLLPLLHFLQKKIVSTFFSRFFKGNRRETRQTELNYVTRKGERNKRSNVKMRAWKKT